MDKIWNAVQSAFPFLKRKQNGDNRAEELSKQDVNDEAEEEEEPEDEPIGAVSMNEGTHEKIFGIRRNVVKGIGAFFGVVLLSALLLAPGESERQQSGGGSGFPQASEKDIAAQNTKDRKDSTNDYGALIEANRKKAEAEAAAARANAKSPAVQQEQPKEVQQASATPIPASPPAIPRVTATPTVVPVQQQAPVSATTQTPQKEQKPEKDSRYSSAIAFGFGGGGIQGSAGTEASPEGEGSEVSNTSAPVAAVPVSATATALTPRSLAIGTIIPVRLMTGINTDSIGQVMAMVLSDVTDSLTGSTVLIPAGSKLFGTLGNGQGASSGVSYASGRIPLTFSTILTPDNRSFNVGSAFQAMDGAGYSGVKGKVDKHTGARFGSGMLAAGIAALGSLAAGNTTASNTYSAGQLASQGALASLINQTTSLLQAGGNLNPTTSVKPGYEFSVFVTQNVQF